MQGNKRTVREFTASWAKTRGDLVHIAWFALAATLLAVATSQAGGPVYASAAEVKPLAEGAAVPSARVTTVGGEPVDLAERVREQGALLVFYRGGW